MQPVAPLRDRRERFLHGTLGPPVRRDQAHAGDALHRANHVYASADRPPALARLLHEAEALDPAALRERRGIAAEAPAVQLESQQRKPVLEPQQADVLAAPGVVPPLPAER